MDKSNKSANSESLPRVETRKKRKKEKQKRIFLSCAPDRLQRNSASPPRSPRARLRLPKFHKKITTFLEAIRSLLAWYAKVHQRQVFNVICALDIIRFQASDGFAVFIQTFYPGNSHSNLTCTNAGISEWRLCQTRLQQNYRDEVSENSRL